MLRIWAVGLAMLLFSGICSANLDPALDEAWRQWKIAYRKVYHHPWEESFRRSIWESNLKIIEQHNREAAAGRHTYTLAMNQFADLTNEEFNRIILGFNPERRHR